MGVKELLPTAPLVPSKRKLSGIKYVAETLNKITFVRELVRRLEAVFIK